MKRFLLFSTTIIIGLFAFTNCSKSDSDSDKNNILSGGVKVKNPSALVGKWINTREDGIEKHDWDSKELEDLYGEVTYLYDDDNRFLVLRSDGTGYVSTYHLFEVGQDGDITWNVSGDKLIFTGYKGEPAEYTVMKLTSTTLVLRWVDYHNKNDYNIDIHTFKKATDNDY